jgi:parallel beta-helix repeat protein
MKRTWIALIPTLALVLLALWAVSTAGSRAAPLTVRGVTTTADSGGGSLRQALLDASAGDIITFSTTVFPPGSPATITLTSGPLPEITAANLVIDAVNAGVILDGSDTPTGTSGLVVNGADGVQIKGLFITGFPDSGIVLHNGATNTIVGGDNGTPGGACSGDCNVLSGNGNYGLRIDGPATQNNTVSGNYIGTDASGTGVLPNGGDTGGYGILVQNSASLNVIGGSTAAERNVISGNGDLVCGPPEVAYADGGGVLLWGDAHDNTVRGNYIGTDSSGSFSVPNARGGIRVESDAGAAQILDNVISGNSCGGPPPPRIGIWLGSDGNTVQGNYVGVDAAGTAALPNGTSGIWIASSNNNTVRDNVISGNVEDGLWLAGTGNVVAGNFIGTDAAGTAALPNGSSGLVLSSSSGNTIGGDNATPGGACSGDCNLISGNGQYGLRIAGAGATNNTVSGNYIGTNAAGSSALPNGADSGGYGVLIEDGASLNTIGGTTPAERNVISGNGDLVCGPPAIAYHDGGGVLMWGGAHDNTVRGNYIGIDAGGVNPLPNASDGITVNGDASAAQILDNVISGNSCDGPPPPRTGVYLSGDGNTVQGNRIGTDAAGTTAVPNGWVGVWMVASNDNTVRDNLISGNNTQGIYMEQSANNTVAGNRIGTDVGGVSPLPNADHGIQMAGAAQDNTIGGATPADGNIIAYNGGHGVQVRDATSLRNTLSHNRIWGNGLLGIDLSQGGNLEIFAPLLEQVTPDSVSGLAVPGSTVEVFSDDGAQGRTFEGSVTADAVSGAFSFSQPGGFARANVTATATDGAGNSSEFSAAATPGRDVNVVAIYVPQPRHEVDAPLTPLVRVGNGGTVPETFSVTTVITQSGVRMYDEQQTVTDLGPLHYLTLSFPSWTPDTLGAYTFQARVEPIPADDQPANDELGLAFSVVDSRVDLWARDNLDDDGTEPSTGPVWQSPDLWVRNQDDGLSEPQDPINNTTNTVYVRVRNRGDAAASDAQVTVYWHPPSLVIGQSWWEPIGTAAVGAVAAGEVLTVSLPWQPQVPDLGTVPYHTCLLDVISSTEDLPPDAWDVAGSNNIGQRNVDIISPTATVALAAAPGSPAGTVVSTTFSLGNPYARAELVDVVLDAGQVPAGSQVRLNLGSLFERWIKLGQDSLVGATAVSSTQQIVLMAGREAVVGGLPLNAEELLEVSLEVSGLGGRRAQVDVSQRIAGVVLGGTTLQVQGVVRYDIYLPLVLSGQP